MQEARAIASRTKEALREVERTLLMGGLGGGRGSASAVCGMMVCSVSNEEGGGGASDGAEESRKRLTKRSKSWSSPSNASTSAAKRQRL